MTSQFRNGQKVYFVDLKGNKAKLKTLTITDVSDDRILFPYPGVNGRTVYRKTDEVDFYINPRMAVIVMVTTKLHIQAIYESRLKKVNKTIDSLRKILDHLKKDN